MYSVASLRVEVQTRDFLNVKDATTLCSTSLSFLKSSHHMGTAVTQWLRRCATNRKVAISIPDRVIGIFH
jgi:hypothetical protein